MALDIERAKRGLVDAGVDERAAVGIARLVAEAAEDIARDLKTEQAPAARAARPPDEEWSFDSFSSLAPPWPLKQMLADPFFVVWVLFPTLLIMAMWLIGAFAFIRAVL